MLAEIKNTPTTDFLKNSGSVGVNVVVIATAAEDPTEMPVFSYLGFDKWRSVWITNESADFTLTLSPQGFPSDFQVTFAPKGFITWKNPGKKDQVDKPGYISEPVLSKDGLTITFTDTNTATLDDQRLISFTVSVLVAENGTPGQTFESPDPTIINVDPPGSDDY